jgi:ketosteroid isomerase-like protein
MTLETLMKIRYLIFLALVIPLMTVAEDTAPDVEAVAKVVDDFHDAAAHGDKERYFGHLTDDAVYLGTDEWERWPKYPDFDDYVDGRFKDGSGWNYKSVDRTINFHQRGDVAWFDEVLFSETSGRIRGTGVLTRESGQWKIEHYAMSFLIFNENWDEVIELTQKTRTHKKGP